MFTLLSQAESWLIFNSITTGLIWSSGTGHRHIVKQLTTLSLQRKFRAFLSTEVTFGIQNLALAYCYEKL